MSRYLDNFSDFFILSLLIYLYNKIELDQQIPFVFIYFYIYYLFFFLHNNLLIFIVISIV